jgi:hypothetical protein
LSFFGALVWVGWVWDGFLDLVVVEEGVQREKNGVGTFKGVQASEPFVKGGICLFSVYLFLYYFTINPEPY